MIKFRQCRIALMQVLALIIITFSSKAQTPGLGTWNTVNARLNFNEHWNVFAETQVRSQKFYYDFSYHEIKGGVGYNVGKSLAFLLAAGQYVTYTPTGNFKTPVRTTEFRIWQQLMLTNNIDRLKIDHRYRIEQRFFASGFRNRFRYLINPLIPINKRTIEKNTLYTSFFTEIFLTDKAPHYERSRFFAGIGYRFSKTFAFQSGILRQYDYQVNTKGMSKTYFQSSLLFTFNEDKSKRESHPMPMD